MSDNAPISKKLGYGVIAIQVIIFLLFVDDKAMTLGIGVMMASLFFAHDKSDTVKFGIWGVIGLFVVYHFNYGLYTYSRTPAKTVCGTFKEFYQKSGFKRQDLMLSMYATDEQKVYDFMHIHRYHEHTDFFKNRYDKNELICVDYIPMPAFTLFSPHVLKEVRIMNDKK
ncbi:MAG: hypothetical protein Q4D68_03380 [Moraxella equi]|nr:hypothetical protein [Moraxella equi]